MPVKVILFVAYGGGHINMLLPLIKELKKSAFYKVVVLGLTTAKKTLNENGISYLQFSDFLTSEDDDAVRWGKQLTSDLDSKALIDKEESIAYLGLSYKALVKQLGEKKASKLYKTKGRAAFLPIPTLEKVFFSVSPDLVVATNSPRAEKAAILTARKYNVPSICLMDLFDQREIDDRLGMVGYADKICVFSEAVKYLLIRSGRPSEDVVVTGNPDFDALADSELKERAKEFRKRNNISSGKVVLWARHAGRPNFKLNEMIDDEVIKIAKKNKKIFFIIRPHPNEPKKFNNLPSNMMVSTLIDSLHEVLLSSNLVLTIASTVGLQAASCGIPLITFDMGPTSKFTPYSKMNLSTGIVDLDNLEREIKNVFTHEFKPKKGLSATGRATNNVLNEISKLVK